MKTLFLRPDTWDLCLDASGGIAVASDPYATTQNVASAIRLVKAELWYDTSQGIPYFKDTLGQSSNPALYKAQVEAAALNVDGVASALCTITGFVNRQYTGQVAVTLTTGQTLYVQI